MSLINIDQVTLAKQLVKRTNIARNRMGIGKSLSKDLSELQQGYMDVLQGLLKEYDLSHPFEQDAEGIAKFFEEASVRWKRKKADMGL